MRTLGFRAIVLFSFNTYVAPLCTSQDISLNIYQYVLAKRWADYLVQTVSTSNEFENQYGFLSSAHNPYLTPMLEYPQTN